MNDYHTSEDKNRNIIRPEASNFHKDTCEWNGDPLVFKRLDSYKIAAYDGFVDQIDIHPADCFSRSF